MAAEAVPGFRCAVQVDALLYFLAVSVGCDSRATYRDARAPFDDHVSRDDVFHGDLQCVAVHHSDFHVEFSATHVICLLRGSDR